ncbi:hypothetical protein VTN77DRAFT_9565 [Rasamsonia byssochlamydoides]|uniref:uncharacterized protein n=1 Tax=Rasamsonia byssochlamydoides TaxID=89139 RepID=UPI003742D51C
MPIFQDPDRVLSSYQPWLEEEPSSGDDEDRESSRSRSRNWKGRDNMDVEMGGTGTSPVECETSSYRQTSDRGELIQCIKRGENPTWVLNRSLGDHVANHSHSKKPNLPPQGSSEAGLKPGEKETLASPAEIERPRSALHSGDFREGSSHTRRDASRVFDSHEPATFRRLGSSPTTPWYNHSLSSPLTIKGTEASGLPMTGQAVTPVSRSRAPSLGSFSSSYVLKAPTSPLVHQANNTDLDQMDLSTSPERSNRRRTLPPETFRQLHGSPPVSSRINLSRSYQAQPRRSLTSTYSLQLASSPQTPHRPRRPSFASDLSPLLHAPMVGSYEESILRGRMSTTPSKPLDFTAQIGVLGKGKCKPNLRCPPHVTVPFPAVFYSYPTSGNGRSISDDSPSPYVGLIDLENSLPPDISSEDRRRQRHGSPQGDHLDASEDDPPYLHARHTGSNEHRKREKKSTKTDSLKAPPGGCYRIPQKGQLQIVIKNPNKTAVKLFLVPYDLDGMEPGTKTFIRQRSYSAGPIIDMPLTARKNLGTDRPEASLNPTEDPKDKPILRYLIHLNICCPAKGRFYLYSTIRVVFANRVPDGKEKLRNEIQYPEPRYSPYKPTKEASSSSAAARSALERAFRRRSAGLSFGDSMAHAPSPYPHRFPSSSTVSTSKMAAIPFQLSSGSSEEHRSAENRPLSDAASSQRPAPPSHSEKTGTGTGNAELYSKLTKGDAGYGGGRYPFGRSASASSGSEAGESLLAKRLKDWSCKSEDT